MTLEDAFFNTPEGSLLYNYEGWDPRYGTDAQGRQQAIDSYDEDFKSLNGPMWNCSTRAKHHMGKAGWVDGAFERKSLLVFKNELRLLQGSAEELKGKVRHPKFNHDRDRQASPHSDMGIGAPKAGMKELFVGIALSEDLPCVFLDHE